MSWPVYVAGAAALAASLPRLKARLELSKAKHPSLRGHARIGRWVATLVPFYEYDEDVLFRSDDAKQAELRELLADVAACSEKLTLTEVAETVPGVQFDILRDGKATGIRFRGVPGGHEFTSLIVALLNTDGKGKLPDEGVRRRVRALKGPVRLRTYVSLSCTNCPDVVQALNQMALIHADFRHEMIDGELAEADIESLGIQGVPAVVHGNSIVHVGRANFAELLETLEGALGREAAADAAPQPPQKYDVVVLGGGPAGSSAAIYSSRKGLKTALVAQRMGGQVQETVGIENLISVPYTEGRRLAADIEKHLRVYAIDLLDNRKVEQILDQGKHKEVRLQGGEVLHTDALIIATGAKWRELGVPGEKDYLGRGVAFCPNCDGPFYKGKRVAVVGGGNSGVEAGIDLAGICSHVTLFEFAAELKADEVLVRNLKGLPNVTIITNAREAPRGRARRRVRADRPDPEQRPGQGSGERQPHGRDRHRRALPHQQARHLRRRRREQRALQADRHRHGRRRQGRLDRLRGSHSRLARAYRVTPGRPHDRPAARGSRPA